MQVSPSFFFFFFFNGSEYSQKKNNLTGEDQRLAALPLVYNTRDLLCPAHVIPLWQGKSVQEQHLAAVVPMSLDAVSVPATVYEGAAFPAIKAKFTLYPDA
jgi:hypothetical protein